MAKLPSFQFYPGDWKRDAGVQALSYEERGVWFELLLIMFEASPRGKLTFSNGTPMPECAVASMLGLDNQKYNQILSKLLKYGVASKEEDTGIIYCRRMVRDAELSKKRVEAGKLGGNPNLLNQNSSKTEAKPNLIGNQNPTPSSSYSSSNKEKIYKKEKFIPPKLEEVKAYASEKQYAGFNAEKFHAHYQSNGWKVGKNPMKDWKAAVRYWATNNEYNGGHYGDAKHAANRNEGTFNEFSSGYEKFDE